MMTKTYGDLVSAMISASEQGMEPSRVVMTDETMDSFLSDSKFTKEQEREQKDTIGFDWELNVVSGDGDYLITECDTKIPL